MNQKNPLLSVKLEGQSIGSGRIPIPQLLRLLTELNKVLLRSGQVLRGEIDSLRKGPKEKQLKEFIALDLVQITHGSPAVVLGFDRRQEETLFHQTDIGNEVLEKSIIGLEEIQKPGQTLPSGYDAGVLMAWRDMGMLFEQGVSKIQFTLNHRPDTKIVIFNQSGYELIQKQIRGPQQQVNIRTIEGRLLMADFKEHGTRCRVHPSTGDPILCLFDEEQKDEVLENILHYVRIIGEAKEDSMSSKITSIKIRDIRKLENLENVRVDLLPQGNPVPLDFWRSLSLEELAEAQGVHPAKNIQALFGTWPGEENDNFEEDIKTLRRLNPSGESI